MAWIKEIDPKKDKKLNAIYDAAEARTKEKVANVLKVHSVNPDILKDHIQLYETLMFHQGSLSRKLREMIGVVVSKANECPYCVSHHAASLFSLTSDKALMKAVAKDYTKAGLSAQEKQICDYTFKLTNTPYKMTKADIEALKEHNLEDKAIFEINQICAYFNYVNRIVHGLGVELESIR